MIWKENIISQFAARYRVIGGFHGYYGEAYHLFDLFTAPNFAYIIGIVLSALAIFLSFDSIAYISTLKEHGIKISLARRGHPWENGYAERLIWTLKE